MRQAQCMCVGNDTFLSEHESDPAGIDPTLADFSCYILRVRHLCEILDLTNKSSSKCEINLFSCKGTTKFRIGKGKW